MEVCGKSESEVYDMYNKGIVLPIYWNKDAGEAGTKHFRESHVWPGEDGQSKRRRLTDPKSFVYKNPQNLM